MVTSSLMKIKSRELGIGFEQLLNAYVLESTAVSLGTCPISAALWLCSDRALGLDHAQLLQRELVYAYHEDLRIRPAEGFIAGSRLDDSFFAAILSYLQDTAKKQGLTYQKESLEEISDGYLLKLSVSFEKMYVPLSLRFYRSAPVAGEEMSLRLLMENNKAVTLQCYPKEMILAEQIGIVLKNMELLPELTPYLEIYEILGVEACEGRRMQELLTQECRKLKIPIQAQRLEQLQTYGDYTYLRKKWNTLLRRQKKENPKWEDVMRRFLLFFTPIWEAMTEEKVFFGDWMPQLQRFLD